MQNKDKVAYWVDLANYDIDTAHALLEKRRYLYVGFMCHQVIEKMLKAFYVTNKYETPPYTHNLRQLANKTGLYTKMTDSQKDILDVLMPLNIEARYPTYKEELLKTLHYKRSEHIINQTQRLKSWIEQQL